MRKPDNSDIGLQEDCEDDLVDVRCNADLHVANQESTDSICETSRDDSVNTISYSTLRKVTK